MTARVDDPQTPEIYRTLDVYRHLSHRPVLVVCKTPWYFGFHTHRHENRTVSCPGETICIACENHDEKRWCGAMVASRVDGTHAKLLLFTQSCVQIVQGANDHDTGLIGQSFRFWRVSDDPRSELRCSWEGVVPNFESEWTIESLRHHVDRIFKPSRLLKDGHKYSKVSS